MYTILPLLNANMFKKRQDENPDLDDLDDEKGGAEPANVSKVEDVDKTNLSP